MFGWVKTAGKVAASPITVPVRIVKEKTMQAILGSIIRHALTAAGLGAVMSGDEMNQAVGALATIIGLAWSIAPKIVAARKAA